MSTSMLYRVFGVREYRYVRTRYVSGCEWTEISDRRGNAGASPVGGMRASDSGSGRRSPIAADSAPRERNHFRQTPAMAAALSGARYLGRLDFQS